MIVKYSKMEEFKMVKFLRFWNQDPNQHRFTYMSLQAIAKYLSKSIAYVARIVKKIRIQRWDEQS